MDVKTFLVTTLGAAGNLLGAFIVVKVLMDLINAKSKILSSIYGKTQGLTNKAKEFAEGSNFYQRRKMADEARKQERRRANVEDYAAMVSGTGIRSNLLRRRAAGGVTGQLFNTNRAGQQRIAQSAEEQLLKQRHEEASRAATRMARMGFEGDSDFLSIAQAAEGSQITSRTGQVMTVTGSDRQAAINNLVQQGRTSQIRGLEALQARGPQGAPISDMHHMLDEAYKEYGSKLADKAPDLMPSRRASEGLAAFTDLKPDDVTGWHHSTVTAAENWYTATTDARGNPLTAAQITQRTDARDQMLRAFSQATKNPSTRAKLSLEQVTQVRHMMQNAIAGGARVDPTVVGNINTTYTQLGGP